MTGWAGRWVGPVLAGLVTYLIPIVAGILHSFGGR